MLVRILRHFSASGHELVPGQVVDATGWRHVSHLAEQRWIQPLVTGDTADGTLDVLQQRIAFLESEVARLSQSPAPKRRGRPPKGARNAEISRAHDNSESASL